MLLKEFYNNTGYEVHRYCCRHECFCGCCFVHIALCQRATPRYLQRGCVQQYSSTVPENYSAVTSLILNSPPPPYLVTSLISHQQAASTGAEPNGAAPPAPSAGKAGRGGKRKPGGVGGQRGGGGGGGGAGEGSGSANRTRRKRWRPEELDPMIAAEDAELKVRAVVWLYKSFVVQED